MRASMRATFDSGGSVRRKMTRLILPTSAAAAILMMWWGAQSLGSGCHAGTEWSAPAIAGTPEQPGACTIGWWRQGGEPLLGRAEVAEQVTALGLGCPKDPASYQRLFSGADLADHTAADREAWARQIMEHVQQTLLEEVGDTPCASPTWRASSPGVVKDGVVRYDGTYGVEGGPRVPAWLLLPLVSASQPFPARPAMVTIHGHDAGRAEVVDKLDGYQKGIATRLAQAGYVVLAADNVSWGTYNPLGRAKKANHGKDFALYMKPGSPNGLITWNLTDLFHGVTLLSSLHVTRAPDKDRWELAAPDAAGATPAVDAVGVSGLSYGAQMAAYMALDPRPAVYVVSSGLIDTCDVLQNNHHKCQLIKPFQGAIALWDVVLANAILERPRLGLGMGRPAVLVEQGYKDKILRAWGRYGIDRIEATAKALHLDALEVARSKTEGHTYLLEPTFDFLARHLPLPKGARR